ncbi:PREDICTED: SH3 domain-containing RING finger protein 3 [Cyphomyrmex costatus]|uniref:SH3 domain-containing RING finger protein 3 n=1 Tax=Cyphomyrmex costatus TaxID=456900 RepID=UPI0008522EDE|nr:PREDICTED: SH3 domain-containing RING finger protein 3 [Cyphomyrmex costatus]
MDECMLNDLLECSVCLERLDTSSKVLPCQHTFCKKCLEEIVSTHRELRCPECRVLVDAKVDDLPPNVLLMRILEGMRNAAPKNQAKSSLPSSRSSGGTAAPQRLFGGHQVAPAPIVTGNLAPASEPTVRHSNAAAKQVHLHNQAYGRAIYDYVSKVPGDLSFKKGDIVILRKKIDNNWYFGECGNNHGVFPLSYVQVMTPLTPHVPQCKALYDFRMTNDDEDGCLTFNKGEVISVIRRVDENWAEGKLLDRIGIFPLAFVELNSVARALMKLSTNVQPGPSRVAPPTPTNEETTPLIPTDHSRNVQTTSQSRPQLVQNATLQVSDSVSNISSGGSSTTTTPNTPNSSTTSSSSSTAPSSPGSPATSPPAVGNRHNVKRHSFTAVNTGHHAHPHHRHSAEILSPPVDSASNNTNNSGANESFSSLQTSGSCTDHNLRHRRSGSSDLVLAQASQSISAGQTTTSASTLTHLPAAYVALYPYKPQKADELELRKGGIYMVTERCQDGWFKGTSNRTQKCGVFPGNYVAPAKCQRGLCRGSPNSPSQHQGSPLSNAPSNTESRLAVTYTKNKGPAPQPYNPRTLPPPELPPRAISPSTTTVSSSWHGAAQSNQGPNQETNPPRHNDQNATPLGRSHSAVMTANIPSPGKQIVVSSSLQPAAGINNANNGCSSITISAPSSSIGDMNRSPNNTLRVASGTASSNAATSASKTTEKTKEKKDKCVSLMRRLTNIKKSKSPPPATYSMDNPVFDDGNSVNPMHVRSGSCPSQLLQVIPTQELNASNSPHRLCPGSVQGHVTSSQRLKYKERPSLPVSITQRSNESGTMVQCATVGNHHRKSNSLDAGMGKQMKQQSSRDRAGYRFRCIVPYPPNSEFELELRVGDIIYVQKKRDDGWYKGMQQRTGRTGLFPASFVEAF